MIGILSRKTRRGFTIIEVSLFLAITGFLLMGLLYGTGAMIARQRYNDSVQDLAEFLRRQYSAVVNPEIPIRQTGHMCTVPNSSTDAASTFLRGTTLSESYFNTLFDENNMFVGQPTIDSNRGRSDCVVYGVMVHFGEARGERIRTTPIIGMDYDVIVANHTDTNGELIKLPDGRTIEDLTDIELLAYAGISGSSLYMSVLPDSLRPGTTVNGIAKQDPPLKGNGEIDENEVNSYFNQFTCQVGISPVPGSSEYGIQWLARAQKPTWMAHGNSEAPVESTVLIFRSPRNGVIHTYYTNDSLTTNYGIDPGARFGNGGQGNCSRDITQGSESVSVWDRFSNYYDSGSLSKKIQDATFCNGRDIDEVAGCDRGPFRICVGSDDLIDVANRRRMIVINVADGRNASAVEIVEMDSTRNSCDTNTP